MLMTSRRPKMRVSPSATRTIAMPIMRPSTTCGATTNCRWAAISVTAMFSEPGIRESQELSRSSPRRLWASKLFTLVGNSYFSRWNRPYDFEVFALHLDNVHVERGLIFLLAHHLAPLRRVPACTGDRLAERFGIQRTRFLRCGFNQVN